MNAVSFLSRGALQPGVDTHPGPVPVYVQRALGRLLSAARELAPTHPCFTSTDLSFRP